MYYKMLTRKIKNKKNKTIITNEMLTDTLKHIAINYPFSTFPYIIAGFNSSKSAKYLSSGNCVALSIAGQKYLKNKYNIKSYLIPASIPKIFQDPDYLHICHVALYIPQNKNLAFILDFAFYFKTPIVINLNDLNKNISCKMMNTYHGIEENLSCKLHILEKKTKFNEYQTLFKNTKFIKTYYNKDPNDSWNYYIREIINPDKCITNFYIKIKKNPFLCVLDENYNFKLYIKFLDNQNFIIKKYQNTIFNGNLFELSFEILNKIKPIISKYFNYNVLTFLNKFNPYKNLFFKDYKKTKKKKKHKNKEKIKKYKLKKTLKR